MRLRSTTIRNFKGIENCQIEFKPGFNLIKGENGKGKTSILEAIAVGLGGYIAGMNGVNTRHIAKEEIRNTYVALGDASCDVITHVPTEIHICADIAESTIEWTRSRNSVNASRSTIQPRDIVKKAEEMSNDVNSVLPIILYQGAGRVWSQKREKSENPFKTKYVRTVGYMDALSDASNVKLLQNWCIKMEMQYMKTKTPVMEYEAVKRTVADFMSKMEGKGSHEVFFDPTSQEIMYRVNDKVLPVSNLSAGYQSLIWMVFDIAYRMAILNPSKLDKINETEGIVLIDELDINEAMNNYQEVNNRSNDVQNAIDLFYMKLDEEDYEEAEKILNTLEQATDRNTLHLCL